MVYIFSTRYAEEIKTTNLVGEVNSQEGSWELMQHMILDAQWCQITCYKWIHYLHSHFPVLIYLYIWLGGWMDALCESTCSMKAWIFKLMETGQSYIVSHRGDYCMKTLGMLGNCECLFNLGMAWAIIDFLVIPHKKGACSSRYDLREEEK